MTIKELINKGILVLKKNNVEYPKLKSTLLMEYILDKSRQYIIVNDEKEVTENEENRYLFALEQLSKGSPVEYIIHKKEFMKLNFFVDENVLIPRQDTEILVEEVIGIAQKINAKKILDLCTGSGAIAISLAKYLPQSEITAIDISKEALKIANKNANINEVQNQIKFINSDMFEQLQNEKFDIIVSNPPYIKRTVIEDLDEEVKKEPHIALDGGEDGLYFYKKIVKQSNKYLKKDGYLCLEIGFDQKKEVIELIEDEKIFENTYSKKDLYNNDRIVITKLK